MNSISSFPFFAGPTAPAIALLDVSIVTIYVFRKSTRSNDHIDALKLNGEVRHDKAGVKEAGRSEFKERFDGADKPHLKDRLKVGADGEHDAAVNKELQWEEFERNLQDLKNGRSGGVDGIKNELLKFSGEKTKRVLFIFIKQMLATGYIPEDLNTGRVKLLFKGGDHLNPSNYRPITVSSVIVKLFTKIYGARLSEVLEKEGILNDCQIGFRPGRGTADALLMMHSIIGKHKKKRRPLHLAFVDLTKAYDKVCLLLDLRTILMCPFIFSPLSGVVKVIVR